MGQMGYMRIGQGCTGGPGTYTQLKDIVTSSIPGPDSEPALTDAMPGTVAFDHFVDDDIGAADTFDDLLIFLHLQYFPCGHLSSNRPAFCYHRHTMSKRLHNSLY